MMKHKKEVENKERSHIFQHYRESKCRRFNFSRCKILVIENRVGPRKFIEAAHTKFSESSINRSVDIPSCYYNILRNQFS